MLRQSFPLMLHLNLMELIYVSWNLSTQIVTSIIKAIKKIKKSLSILC